MSLYSKFPTSTERIRRFFDRFMPAVSSIPYPPPKVLLVVDEDQGLRRLITKRMEREGHRCVAVGDAGSAFEWMEGQSESFFLLFDHALPDARESEFLQRLKDQFPRPIPFVIMTGQGDERLAVEMMKQGARDYLVKDEGFLERLPLVIGGHYRQIQADYELYLAKAALAESESRFLNAMAHSPLAIGTVDRLGHWHSLNRRAQDLFAAEHDRESSWMERWTAPSRKVCEESVRQVLEGETQERQVDVELVDARGQLRSCLIHMTRNHASPEGNDSVLIQILDITERVELERKTRSHADLLDRISEAIVVVDHAGLVRYLNRGARRMWKREGNEVFGRRFHEIVSAPRSALEAAWRAVEDSGAWNGELNCSAAGLEELYIAARWARIGMESSWKDHVVMVFTDVSELLMTQKQLHHAQRMENIGALAAGTAHNLNNILAPIILSCDLLESRLAEERDRSLVHSIHSSAERGAGIVRQLLAFGRGVEGEWSNVQIQHLIQDVYTILEETTAKNIGLVQKASKGLWSVEADPSLVHKVLMNLCVNARDAMPEGGTLEIVAENHHFDTPPTDRVPGVDGLEYVRIAVSDTGLGMSAETLEKAFAPFFTTKPIGRGTGLGLSTSLGIVQSFKGFIRVHSQVGEGTTFQVFLPASARTEAPEPREEALAPSPFLSGEGQTALLVEDEDPVRLLAARVLDSAGFRVLVARDGREALELCQSRHQEIQLIFTDLDMPRMDGFEFIRELDRLGIRPQILLTTGLHNGTKVEALREQFGVTEILAKPYSSLDLLDKLQELLASK